MTLSVYFAHPQNTYDTPLEIKCIQAIYAHFNGQISLVNPSENAHKSRVEEIRIECARDGLDKEKTSAKVMEYFKEVVNSCQTGVGLVFRDGTLGAGVFGELERIASNGHPILLIDRTFRIAKTTIEDIRKLELSVNATRARIRFPDGSTRSY